MAVAQKIQNWTVRWSGSPTAGHIAKKDPKQIPKKCVQAFVHSSILLKSRKVEATPDVRQMNGEMKAEYTYSGIVANLKREEILSYGYFMYEPWRHYANKSITKR